MSTAMPPPAVIPMPTPPPTPAMSAALWRYNMLIEHLHELAGDYRAASLDRWPLRSVAEWLNQAQPLLLKHGSEPAVDRLLGEASRYLRNAECNILAEKRKRRPGNLSGVALAYHGGDRHAGEYSRKLRLSLSWQDGADRAGDRGA
jgi:hypothetical protein